MKNHTTALILNVAALVLGAVGIVYRLSEGLGDFFLYYTQLSNIAAVISSAIYIALRDTRSEKLRTLVTVVRYTAVCGLTMTFIVVMCIFIPMSAGAAAKQLLGSVNGFLHHAVCPVLSVASYLFFEEGVRRKRTILVPFAATGVYAGTVYMLNLLRLAEAPYPFFEVYEHEWYELLIWFIGLMSLIAGISFAVRAVNISISRRRNNAA